MKRRINKTYNLAIETTGRICGVAISDNNSIIYESNLDLGINHSVTLFNNIYDGVKKLGISFSNIKFIKVSMGPGSFTGIRIGIATALGISIPNDIPIEYVDTLDSLSHNNVNNSANYVLSMINARANRVYFGFYENKSYRKLVSDYIINVNDLIKLLNKHFCNKNTSFIFIGDGAVKYKDLFAESLKVSYSIMNTNNELKASSLLLTKGEVSKKPIMNYMLASKAERERNG